MKEQMRRGRTDRWLSGACASRVGPDAGAAAGGSLWNTQADPGSGAHPLRRTGCPGSTQPMLAECAARVQRFYGWRVLEYKSETVVQRKKDN